MEVELRMNTEEGSVLLSPWFRYDAGTGRYPNLLPQADKDSWTVDECMLDRATFHAAMRSGTKRHPQGNHVDLDR